jgi:hypothetical protein
MVASSVDAEAADAMHSRPMPSQAHSPGPVPKYRRLVMFRSRPQAAATGRG